MSDGIDLDSAINGILDNTFGEGHGNFYSGYDSLEYQKQQEAKAAEAAAKDSNDSGFDDYMKPAPVATTPAPSSDSGFDDYMKPTAAPTPKPEPAPEPKKESSYDIDELIGSITSIPESAKKKSYDDDYEPFAETKTLAIGKSARKAPKDDYDSSKSKYETRSRYEDDEEEYKPKRPVKKARRVEYDYDDEDDYDDDYEYERPVRRRRGISKILSRRRRSRYDDDMILDLAEIEYQLRRLNEKQDDVKQLEQTQLLNMKNFSRGDSISRDEALELIRKEAIEVAKAEFRKEQELAELRKLASMQQAAPPPPPPAPEPPKPAPLPPIPEPTPFPSITGMNNSASGSYSYKSAFAPGSSGVPVLKPMVGGVPSGPSSFGPKPPMGGMNNNMGGMGNNMPRPGGMPPNGFNPNRR